MFPHTMLFSFDSAAVKFMRSFIYTLKFMRALIYALGETDSEGLAKLRGP